MTEKQKNFAKGGNIHDRKTKEFCQKAEKVF
mgnify:CR=1 FL=1